MNKFLTAVFVLLFFLGTFMAEAKQKSENTRSAYFAGGCFWCMEPPFEKAKGVLDVQSGYMNGFGASPTYKT